MRNGWQALLCLSSVWLASCGDDACSDIVLIAIEVSVNGTAPIDKVTVELDHEEDCGFFSNPQRGPVYTCWEQGGGTYTVRVYSGGEIVGERAVEVAADECHIKERASVVIDLDAE